jgi:signal transduction histidine kinase
MQARIRSFVEDRLRLLAAISHDLRGPITRLRLRLEHMAIDADAQRKMLADLDEMAEMVASSLAFAREGSEPTRRPRRPSRRPVRTLGAKRPWIGGTTRLSRRPLAMKRLFATLFENAVRYCHDPEVQLFGGPKEVRVVVEDHGPGIPPDQLEKVFKPFLRLEQAQKAHWGHRPRSSDGAHNPPSPRGRHRPAEPPRRGLRATVTLPRRPDVGA